MSFIEHRLDDILRPLFEHFVYRNCWHGSARLATGWTQAVTVNLGRDWVCRFDNFTVERFRFDVVAIAVEAAWLHHGQKVAETTITVDDYGIGVLLPEIDPAFSDSDELQKRIARLELLGNDGLSELKASVTPNPDEQLPLNPH